MSANRKTPLCRYQYDPLDRLVDCTPSAQARTQRFYLKERLTSEIQGSVQRSIFQQADQLLAQQQRRDGSVETTLLATDLQRSVLHVLDATQPHPLAYTPYGHRPAENGLLSLLGFNGERPDPVTGHYLLGNGYRAFNPVLMRFNSPDNLSPFGEGGLNAYTYCAGDPVNRVDPTGHAGNFFKGLLNFFKLRTPSQFARQSVQDPKNIQDNLIIFTDDYRHKPRLNILSDGGEEQVIQVGQHNFSPQQLYNLINEKVDIYKFDNIRLIACNLANPPTPFGQKFSTLTNKPVKAMHGVIVTEQYHPKLKATGEVKETVLLGLKILKNRQEYVFNGETIKPFRSEIFHPKNKIRT